MINLRDNSLLVVDLETSGINPFRHDVLAVGLVPLLERVAPAVIYVRPNEIQWSNYARRNFDKYVADWEAGAMPPSNACEAIERYLAQAFPGKQVTPVGHNIGFDVAFLRKLAFLGGRDELATISHRAVDTHTMLYLLFLKGRVPSSALSSEGAFYHFGIEVPEAARHTAIGDALATRELVLRLFELF